MKRIITCCALLTCAVCAHAYELVANVSKEDNTKWRFDIELANNDIDFTAFQMDITLEGDARLKNSDLVCGELTLNHRLMLSNPKGHYRVMALNTGLNPFKEKEGCLFSFTIDGDLEDISFDNIIFVMPDGTKVDAEFTTDALQNSNPDADKETSEEQGINKAVFDKGTKQAYRIDRRGICIQNGKKLMKKD